MNNFTDIESYILRTREERRSHLVLEEPCVFIGGLDSREYRGLLAHHLRTTIPKGRKIVLCHACHHHGCSNPRHLYWGTGRDNIMDQVENGTHQSFADRMKAKYGEKEFRRRMSEIGRKGGTANRHHPAVR